jgi:hypothetical protein
VKVWPGGTPGHADVSDVLTLAHYVAFLHQQARGMEEGAVEPAAVVDDQQVPFERERLARREDDDAVGGCDVGRAASAGGDVEARMIAAGLAAAIDPL